MDKPPPVAPHREIELKLALLAGGPRCWPQGVARALQAFATLPPERRVCRVAALPAPNERERTQWYFQRHAAHLPAASEIVLFDRSWYNRAGVERLMGFCTDDPYEEFFRSVPEFERMLARSGIQLIKYWFSTLDEEQHLRFLARIHDPLKRWKLSPMDLESRCRWEHHDNYVRNPVPRNRYVPEVY